MKVLLDINDSKADFIMKLLKQLSGIKTEIISPAKAKKITSLKQAVEEVKLAEKGKIKLKSARQLLNEL